ncbi:MCE family protein [Nocardia sp. NPDC051832]|uniref:MCE family protein n=1 Tax=Nocardia sp. NPDC051832 TaxID=3155673 RepID=UPI00343ABC52
MGSTAKTRTWREFARVTWQVLRLKVAGAGLVCFLVALVVLVLSMYSGRFVPTAAVTVETARSGLVLNPDAKVAFRGVQIGRVAAVDRVDGRVRLRLELDPDQLRLVPANARVDIRSSTVFGAKFVHMTAPEQPARESLRPGAVLRAESVTVEFNTVFEHLTALLAKVDPVHLNATVTALRVALEGRGDKLGELLTGSDALLRELNPSLPALQRDLAATAEVTRLYAETVADLLRSTANVTGTSGTIVERTADLDAVLASLIGLADTGATVLREGERPLVQALDYLRPTTSVLSGYRTALACVINGIAVTLPFGERLMGGLRPGASFNTNLQMGSAPYRYPQDLPKVNASGGPQCFGAADFVPGSHTDYLVTDTNVGAPFLPSTSVNLNGDTVFQVLFSGFPGVR